MSATIYQDLNVTPEQVDLIKSQICKGASDDELHLFLYTAKKAGVDPLLKQIYSVRRGGQMVIQMGIDGFRAVAARQNDYAPGDEYFEYDKEGVLQSALVTVYKLLPNGQLHKFSKTAFWSEYAQYQYDKTTGKKKLSQFWAQYPRVMLAKCAEAAALRKGWPQVFSKIYAPEEMAIVERNDYPLPEEEPKKVEVQAVEIDVPENMEKEVDTYLNFISEELGKPKDFLKKRAKENPEKFWNKFHEWNIKEPLAI